MAEASHPNAGMRALIEPRFLLACATLAVAAFAVSPMVFARRQSSVKATLDLKETLKKFDKTSLGPYRWKDSETLPDAIEAELGALDYISWTFIDTSITDRRDPRRFVRVLVTYHSGGHDFVPHVPDQCRVGAGYQPLDPTNTSLPVDALGIEIPVRFLSFQRGTIHGNNVDHVAYTFYCNDEFVCTRDAVRFRINDPESHYAYFCKIEVSLGSPQAKPTAPTREEALAGTQTFLNYFLPVLLENHLPSWRKAEAAQHALEATAEDPSAA